MKLRSFLLLSVFLCFWIGCTDVVSEIVDNTTQFWYEYSISLVIQVISSRSCFLPKVVKIIIMFDGDGTSYSCCDSCIWGLYFDFTMNGKYSAPHNVLFTPSPQPNLTSRASPSKTADDRSATDSRLSNQSSPLFVKKSKKTGKDK